VGRAPGVARAWHEKEADWGDLYLEYKPITPMDRLHVEDLAVTMLINSRVAAQAATSVYRNASTLDLTLLPDKALSVRSYRFRINATVRRC
jgi:hypothetical protein